MIFNKSLSGGSFCLFGNAQTSHLSTKTVINDQVPTIEVSPFFPQFYNLLRNWFVTNSLSSSVCFSTTTWDSKGRSTLTNLIVLVPDVICEMEKGCQVDAVYIKIQQANYATLVYLDHFLIGPSPISLMRSDLVRLQFFRLNFQNVIICPYYLYLCRYPNRIYFEAQIPYRCDYDFFG